MFSGFSLAIISAVSRSAAEPEPLSLMPGPSVHGVEVRAGHHDVVVVRAGQLGDDVHVGRVSAARHVDVRRRAGLGERRAVAKLAPTTGIVDVADEASVPTMSPSRSGVFPWLKMITASAPPPAAFIALSAKVQVPRWMSAMSAGAAKQAGEVGRLAAARARAAVGTRLMSTGMTLRDVAGRRCR